MYSVAQAILIVSIYTKHASEREPHSDSTN